MTAAVRPPPAPAQGERDESENRSRADELKKLMNSVRRLEKRKEGGHTFKSAGISKQADYLLELEDWLQEDLRDALEEEMGTLPDSIEAVVKAGEKMVADRVHTLKLGVLFWK